MVKNPSQSILNLRCFRKIMLISGVCCLLLVSGSFRASASSGLGSLLSGDIPQRSVTGRVVDASNNPMPGVNVLEKNTTNGVQTGADGRFSILVSPRAVLTFSFIGYEPQDVTVGSQTVVNVTLSEIVTGLDEVVVVGYGTQRKEAVTGSVASMAGDAIRDIPSSNITQALQGRVSGVNMEQTSTKPGATLQIRIRGTRSLNASNDPLVVLDGIPFAGSIGDINTGDIKSIDILKDAAATAIYGSRGANGVILITTNKGRMGQKAMFTYNGYYGMKSIFAQYPMMNGPEFRALRTAANMYPIDGADESDSYDTNWQDLFYRTGAVTSHDLGVTGGTQKGSYTFGVGYYKDVAVVPGQDYTRFSMRGTLDQEIGKLFRFGFTTNNNYSITMGNNLGLYGVLSMSPLANPYNTDGTWKRTIKMPLDEQWTYSKDIINKLGDKWIDQAKAYGSYNTIFGEVKIPGIEGLKYRVNLGGNLRMSTGGSYTGEGVFALNPTTVSTASISNSLSTNWAIENLLTFDRTFGKHQVNVVGLYSAEQTLYNRSQLSAKDIPADALQFYNLGRAAGEYTVDPNNQDYQMSGLMSYMGRVMYSYDNRYMLSATYRSDASSRLAAGHKWHSYPALSVGWNIKNESFMRDISLINILKLRAGYGETSNQSIAPYATLGRLATRPYNFGSLYSTGFYVSTLPNPDLGWEFSKTWNFGLDFALLKNRLSGTVEYYITNTEDILLNINLPSTSGVGSYTGNIGATQNKGWEVSLNGVLVESPGGFTWEAGLNLYANRNKLVALASGQPDDKTNWWFVGHPIDVIYDYEKIGIWQEEDQYLNILEGPAGKPGMIKVKYTGTTNADGSPTRLINSTDQQVISLEPKFQGGFNTRLAYKGFDLGIIGAFRSGGILISTLYSSSGYLNLMSGRRGNVKVDYWTPENTGAKYPKPGSVMSGDNPKYGSTLGYFNGSYLKIRNISLGYNLEGLSWINNAGINKLRIYCTVQNPFVLFSPYTKESGMDPETNSYGNENQASPGYQRRLLTIGTNTPSTRNYLIGINLTF